MPILPPITSAPYPNMSDVLNLARVRVNDAIQSIDGDVLTDNQPFTQVMANAAWQRLQEFCANLGFARLTQEVILTGVPPVESTDPASQTWMNWSQYFDGQNYFNAPVLPQDLILPLKVWERWSGQNAVFTQMEMWIDGMPNWTKQNRNVIWEWREDAIYMPGSLMTMDWRLRYAAYLPDFIDVGETPWYDSPVPIMRSKDALAWYICSEVANPRGDLDGSVFDTKAEAAAKRIFNREVSQRQRVNVRRMPRSAGSRCGRGNDGDGY